MRSFIRSISWLSSTLFLLRHLFLFVARGKSEAVNWEAAKYAKKKVVKPEAVDKS